MTRFTLSRNAVATALGVGIISLGGMAYAAPDNAGQTQQPQEEAKQKQTIALPPSPDDPQMQDLAQRQFELSTEQVLPLTPEQIRAFKSKVGDTTQAMRPLEPPKMVTRSAKLKLEPGVTPPALQVAPGYVSTVLFYDSSGAPWPITSITVGNANKFSVQHNENLKPGNMITVSPLSRHSHTNLAVTLQNQSLPVVLSVKTDDAERGAIHDSLVSFSATMRGPLAEKPTIGGVAATSVVDETMLGFVDGVPPASAKFLNCVPRTDGVSVWKYDGQIYVRSRHAAVWPAWNMVANGTGDVRVYKMPVVPSIMLSVNGATQTLSLEEVGQ